MFTIFSLPKGDLKVAFSGGVDSLALAHFLAVGGRRKVTLYHYNHGCEASDKIESDCRFLAAALGCNLEVGHCDTTRDPSMSLEDHWRRCRYRWLRSFDAEIMTCHHLDDAVETWVWSALHGEPKLIPVRSGTIYRPLLMTRREELEDYVRRLPRHLKAVDDPYNHDDKYMRAYMRQHMMEHILHINPGIHKVIRKKYLKEQSEGLT